MLPQPSTSYSRRRVIPGRQEQPGPEVQPESTQDGAPAGAQVQRKQPGGQQPPMVPPPPAMMQLFQPLPSATPQQLIMPNQQPPGATYGGGSGNMGLPGAEGSIDIMSLLRRLIPNG